MTTRASDRSPQPYADPYLAGAALGLVLLASYGLVGRGLGASGAFATVASTAITVASKGAAAENSFVAGHLVAGGLWSDWLVVELAAACVGAWLSARLAGRLRVAVERGPRSGVGGRLAAAGAGGGVMGVGAVLARGCTSGQALTGGALLSVGSWVFIGASFAAAYAVAWLRRGAWS